MRFSHIRSSVLPSRIGIIFILQIPSTFSTSHTEFEQDCLMQSRNMSLQNLVYILCFFSFLYLGDSKGLDSTFCTLYKNLYKMLIRTSVLLNFGKL